MSRGEGIQVVLLPPSPLVSNRVIFRVVNRAKWNRELVAHLEREAPWLGDADVMRVARRPSTNKTRLLSDKPQMLLGTDALRLADGEHALVDLVVGAIVPLASGFALPSPARLTRSTAQRVRWLTIVGAIPGRSWWNGARPAPSQCSAPKRHTEARYRGPRSSTASKHRQRLAVVVA